MKGQFIKKGVGIFMLIGFILAASAAVTPVHAQEMLSAGYEFGPATARQNSSGGANLRVPARTTVGVVVTLQRDSKDGSGGVVKKDVSMIIEITKPDNTVAASKTATATTAQAGLPIPSVSFPAFGISQSGCPNVWKVRIKTADGQPSPVRVFGAVTFAIVKPLKVNLALESGEFNLNSNSETTKTLTGHDIADLKRALLAGTGVFRIKAKFHTDPLDVLNLFKYFKLKVELLKPDGSVAASETGYSQHAPSDKTPKVDFSYTVTADDAKMSGAWKLRVTSPSGNPRITGFGIEKGTDVLSSLFNATFQAQCSDSVTAGGV